MSFKNPTLAMLAAAAALGVSACGYDNSVDHLVLWSNDVALTCPNAAAKNFDTCFYELPVGANNVSVAAVNPTNRLIRDYTATLALSSSDPGSVFSTQADDATPITSYKITTDAGCKLDTVPETAQCDWGIAALVVTLVAEGQTTLTATAGGQSAKTVVTVVPAP